MDPKKLQKKYKITSKELVKEMKIQADEMVDLLDTEIDELGAEERILNLRDLTMRNLLGMQMINEDNKYDYGMVVYKSIVKTYWKERENPIEQRAIYGLSYTDKGLREHQRKNLDKLIKKQKEINAQVINYRGVIKEWWQQRADEATNNWDPNRKPNGKRK